MVFGPDHSRGASDVLDPVVEVEEDRDTDSKGPCARTFWIIRVCVFLVIPFVSILSITVVLWNEFGIIIAALGIPLALLNQWVVRRLMIAVILRSFRALFGAEPPPSAFSSASTT